MATDGMEYEETGGKRPKTKVNILERTDTSTIISHLMYRHRVGLLSGLSFISVGFIVYDKIITIFI